MVKRNIEKKLKFLIEFLEIVLYNPMLKKIEKTGRKKIGCITHCVNFCLVFDLHHTLQFLALHKKNIWETETKRLWSNNARDFWGLEDLIHTLIFRF